MHLLQGWRDPEGKPKYARCQGAPRVCIPKSKRKSTFAHHLLCLEKMEEDAFLEELEKTYGIYMQVDEFVKELKQKLKKINNFKSLFEYVGVELEKEKTDLDVVLEAYERAKEKGYIRDPNQRPKKISFNYS